MKRMVLKGLMILSAALLISSGGALAATGTFEVPGNVADYTAGLAANGIGATRHNMGGLGRVVHTDGTTPGTSEICVFCHTPHHTNTDTAPLWNRNMPNSGSYVAYGTTVAGTDVSSFNTGSISLACLSCHDGVTAFDDLVNAPGKGLNSGDQHWQFRMNGTPALNEGFDHFGASVSGVTCDGCHALFSMPAQAARLNLGTDLTNDHPVNVVYSGGSKASLRPESTVINSINLTNDLAAGSNTLLGGNLSQNRWAVAGFISDSATIGDLLRGGRVECSSCHDPHFKNETWDEVDATWWTQGSYTPGWCTDAEDCSDGNFLRRVGGNTGSGVCRTCHWK